MDKQAFIKLIQEHQNLIYKICHSFCTDPEDRKDLEQEILLQLWKSMGRFEGKAKVSTWIYRVALNTATVFRRTHAKHRLQRTRLDAAIISLSVEQPEPDERIAYVYQFIHQLSDPNKALMLLYLDGMKYREIGEILGISETNVATKLSRIKQQMKQIFSKHQIL